MHVGLLPVVMLCTGVASGSALAVASHASATPQIYTLSLHDALPISSSAVRTSVTSWYIWSGMSQSFWKTSALGTLATPRERSEEHTSELQSLRHLVCRLLLEKKKSHE